MYKEKDVTIKVPKHMYKKIEKRSKEKDFDSVSDYIFFILKQVVRRIENEQWKEKRNISAKDEQKIKERLKALGY